LWIIRKVGLGESLLTFIGRVEDTLSALDFDVDWATAGPYADVVAQHSYLDILCALGGDVGQADCRLNQEGRYDDTVYFNATLTILDGTTPGHINDVGRALDAILRRSP